MVAYHNTYGTAWKKMMTSSLPLENNNNFEIVTRKENGAIKKDYLKN